MSQELPLNEQNLLLSIARQALEHAVNGKPEQQIKLDNLPLSLQKLGASFVTLTIKGQLRGCIGAIEAYQPLALDVQQHAIAAALQDFRFPNVQPEELATINIEISVLTAPSPVLYDNPQDLVSYLRPYIDGVILQDGYKKATFLPQVWQKLTDPEDFLTHLCMKMGASGNLWRDKLLSICTYQVQEFHE